MSDPLGTASRFHHETSPPANSPTTAKSCSPVVTKLPTAMSVSAANVRTRSGSTSPAPIGDATARESSALGTHLFTQSRNRKARLMDGLAVTLLMLLMAALGCAVVLLSPQAKANPGIDPDVVDYAVAHADAVCTVLDRYPTLDGVGGVGMGIINAGWTANEAGQIMYLSVYDMCPEYLPLLKRFATRYGA